MNINKYIIHLPKVKTIKESINVFKDIYNIYSIEEWLNEDILFKVSNSIAKYRPDLISVGIRLNVQINLFLRSINNYSSNADYILKKVKHSLGCFALTENEAGVLSGLIVKCQFKKKVKLTQ